MNTLVVLNKEDRDNKFFLIFDIRRNAYIRRFQKKDLDQEAFAIDHTGRILAFTEDDCLHLKLCRLPNSKTLN